MHLRQTQTEEIAFGSPSDSHKVVVHVKLLSIIKKI